LILRISYMDMVVNWNIAIEKDGISVI